MVLLPVYLMTWSPGLGQSSGVAAELEGQSCFLLQCLGMPGLPEALT